MLDSRCQQDDMRESLVPVGDSDRDDNLQKTYIRRVALRNVIVTLTCTSCMLSLYGYDFGITAWNILDIKNKGEDELSNVYVFLTAHTELLGILVACVPLGGVVGGLLGRQMSNNRGRKSEIRLVNMLCMAGALLEGLAGTRAWTRYFYVYLYVVGRVVYGVGLGLCIRCGPIYLRETVAAQFRDAATVSVKLSMIVGMIVSYVVGGLINNILYGYFGAILIATVSLACLTMMPESPLYMLLHEDKYPRKQVVDAVSFTNPCASEVDVQAIIEATLSETLAYTPGHPSFARKPNDERGATVRNGRDVLDGAERTPGVSTASVGGIGGTIANANNAGSGRGCDMSGPMKETDKVTMAEAVKNLPSVTKAPGMRSAVRLTSGLMMFEQASGMAAILYYGGVFLADVDVIPVDWGLALLAVLQLAIAIVVVYAVDPVGRKPLLLYGVGALLASCCLLTVGGALGLTDSGRWWALIGLYSFTASYSVSLGALVWVLVSEVFPTCHRAQAVSIVCTAHFASSAMVITLLPVVQQYLGGYTGMFACFLAVAVVGNCFAHRYMVETKGLTLLEVQHALTIKADPRLARYVGVTTARV